MTGSPRQSAVGKLRLRSTPWALPRVPRTSPSGLAASTTAQCGDGSPSVRSARDSATVVSPSSPWIPAWISSLHAPDGRHTSRGRPSTERPYVSGVQARVPMSFRARSFMRVVSPC